MAKLDDLKSALMERGHTEDQIKKMKPEKRFDEYCNWHGLIGWGPTLRRILKECHNPEPPS